MTPAQHPVGRRAPAGPPAGPGERAGRALVALGLAAVALGLALGEARAGALARSCVVAATAAAVAVAAGLPLAWVLARRRPPGARVALALVLVALALPPFLTAVGWSDLVGPGGRLLRLAGADPSGRPSRLAGSALYTPQAAGALLGLSLAPLATLAGLAACARLAPGALEAARLARGAVGERRVALAGLAPAAVVAGGAVFALAVVERAQPLLLLPVERAAQVERVAEAWATTHALGPALRAALPLVGLAWLGAGAAAIALGRGALAPSGVGLGRLARPGARASGGARARDALALALAAAPVVVGAVAAPLVALAWRATDSRAAGGGALDAVARAWPFAGGDAGRSLALGLATAGLACGGALALALAPRPTAPDARLRAGPRAALGGLVPVLGAGLAVALATCPPPLLAALALRALDRPGTTWVVDGPAIVLLLELARFAPLAGALALAARRAVPPDEVAAARLAGRAPARVVLGHLGPALVAAAAGVHVLAATEFSAAAVAAPPGGSLLAVFAVNEAHYGTGAELAGLLVLLLAVALGPPLAALAVRAVARAVAPGPARAGVA